MNSQVDKLKGRIPYDEDIFGDKEIYNKIITSLLEDSENIALETLYPFEDFSKLSLPAKYYNWQIRCCIELYNMADKQGITNYTENGISWAKLTDGLSKDLMSKLTSKVGVPKSESDI